MSVQARLTDDVVMVVAKLERRHGCARVLTGPRRLAVLRAIGAPSTRVVVVDCGEGGVATYASHAALLRMHGERPQ